MQWTLQLKCEKSSKIVLVCPDGYPSSSPLAVSLSDWQGGVNERKETEAILASLAKDTIGEPAGLVLIEYARSAIAEIEITGDATVDAIPMIPRLPRAPRLKMPRSRWTELHRNTSHLVPVTLDQLIQGAKFEVKRSLDHAGFRIDGEVAAVLEPSRFAEFCQLAADVAVRDTFDGDKFAPLLTWHGSKYNCISSIVRHGFLGVESPHPETGEIHLIENGNFYGDGIYTSSMCGVAAAYTDVSIDTKQKILVTLILPGRLKLLHKVKYVVRFRSLGLEIIAISEDIVDKSHATLKFASNRYFRRAHIERNAGSGVKFTFHPDGGETDDERRKRLAECLLQGEFDTLATANLDIVVSANPNWVIPILEVKGCIFPFFFFVFMRLDDQHHKTNFSSIKPKLSSDSNLS